ncbi:unnamed protein product [Caenorhabditis brenneri]
MPSVPDNEDFPALTSAASNAPAKVQGVWAQRKPDQMMKLSRQSSETKSNAWSNSVSTAETKLTMEVLGNSGDREGVVDKTFPPPNGSATIADEANEPASQIEAPSPTSPISIDLKLSKLHLNDSPILQTTPKSLLSPEENMWSSLRNVVPNASKLSSAETENSESNCIPPPEDNHVSNEYVPVTIPGCSAWGNTDTSLSALQTSEVVSSSSSSSSSGNTPIVSSSEFPGLPSSSTTEDAPQSPTSALDQTDFPSLCPSAPVITPVWNRAPPPAPAPVALPVPSEPTPDIDFDKSSSRKTMKRLSTGTKITLMTNCYQMTVRKTKVYYYDVKMKKQYTVNGQKRYDDLTASNKKDAKKKVDNKELNLRILQLLFRRLRLIDVPFAYDGCHNLHLLNPLENLIGRKQVVKQCLENEDLPEDMSQSLFNKTKDGRIYISLTLNEKVPFYQLDEIYNESLDEGVNPCRNVIQLILLQPAKNGDFFILPQNQIFEKSKFRTIEGEKFELSDLVKVGIKASVKVGEGGNDEKGVPFICLDHCKSNFFLEGPLASVQQYLPINFESQNSCRTLLKGLEVLSIYNNTKMKIVDFSSDSLEKKEFKETNSNENKSVWDDAARLAKKKKSEFNKNYKVAHLSFGSSKKSYYFPIENIRLVPYQKMSPHHRTPPTPSDPRERVQESQRIAEKAGILKSNNLMKKFGITVSNEPIEVTGWKLDIPQVLYAGPNNKPHRVFMDSDSASWNPSGKFVASASVKKIHILYTESPKNKNLQGAVEAFKKDLINESASLWTKITDKQITIEKLDVDFRGNSFEGILTAKLDKLSSDTYVVYIDEKRDNPSHGVVKLVERKKGRMIQHIAIDEALKRMKSKSTPQFILMKMNVKLGGLNHRVLMNGNISHLWGEASNTLIISYDVCHSSGARTYTKGEPTDEPSVVGFGFNGLRLPEQVIGDFALQDSRQEQVDCEILMKKTQWMVKLYRENRKTFPANIVILRDGVSEGQYKMTQNKELNAILRGIHGAMRTRQMTLERPKFAYIIATKRHANRLFVKNMDTITNTSPMTAVDTGIVRKGGDEVIFVSHHPLGGTAQPIMLNTLHNEIFESHDQLISFIGALCCTHQRSASIISLPETIFTADAYAKRGAELFETYSHCVRTRKEKLPMKEGGKPDWTRITEDLCYQTSPFATKCMV